MHEPDKQEPRQELEQDLGELEAEIERIAAGQGCEHVHTELKRGGRHWFLRITIDKEDGVTLKDCENVSKELSAYLDVVDVIPHAYDLEVESPGLDRRLYRPADYARFAGRRVKIQLGQPMAGRRVFYGKILGVEQGVVALVDDESKEPYTIRLDQIATAKLQAGG